MSKSIDLEAIRARNDARKAARPSERLACGMPCYGEEKCADCFGEPGDNPPADDIDALIAEVELLERLMGEAGIWIAWPVRVKGCECVSPERLPISSEWHRWWIAKDELCDPCLEYWGAYQRLLEDAIDARRNMRMREAGAGRRAIARK